MTFVVLGCCYVLFFGLLFRLCFWACFLVVVSCLACVLWAQCRVLALGSVSGACVVRLLDWWFLLAFWQCLAFFLIKFTVKEISPLCFVLVIVDIDRFEIT